VRIRLNDKQCRPTLRNRLELHELYPDTILLFRIGDFYEAFDDDAKVVAEECRIMLTGGVICIAGFPCTSSEKYVKMLVDSGFKVGLIDNRIST